MDGGWPKTFSWRQLHRITSELKVSGHSTVRRENELAASDWSTRKSDYNNQRRCVVTVEAVKATEACAESLQ